MPSSALLDTEDKVMYSEEPHQPLKVLRCSWYFAVTSAELRLWRTYFNSSIMKAVC